MAASDDGKNRWTTRNTETKSSNSIRLALQICVDLPIASSECFQCRNALNNQSLAFLNELLKRVLSSGSDSNSPLESFMSLEKLVFSCHNSSVKQGILSCSTSMCVLYRCQIQVFLLPLKNLKAFVILLKQMSLSNVLSYVGL